ncbi:MAG TPA: ribosomal RNA small subunit methyltransferase A [Thermoplasmata archaeon]|nr:ribosomal RNA small subunit methyltransferase A [Thermoplasmata archaeon]
MSKRENLLYLKEQMKALGFRPKKSLGQTFLLKMDIARKMVNLLEIEKGERVLEIGPGFGALTTFLLEKRKEIDFSLTLIEKDRKLHAFLKKHFPEVEIVCGDVLTFELSGFDKFISTLPYSITTPLSLKMFELKFKKAVFMYQKEFAERLTARHKDKNYSRIGLKGQFKLNIEKKGTYSPLNFYPRPEVHSTLLVLSPRAQPPFQVEDQQFFFLIVDILFAYRRKTIQNCLKKEWEKIVNYLNTNCKTSKTKSHIEETISKLPYLKKRG